MNTCPDCKCEFVQPFRCATCGAQKLYDHTVTSQQQTIDALRARVAELEAALRHIADSGTDYDSPAWASRRAAQALGVAGNKTEVPK